MFSWTSSHTSFFYKQRYTVILLLWSLLVSQKLLWLLRKIKGNLYKVPLKVKIQTNSVDKHENYFIHKWFEHIKTIFLNNYPYDEFVWNIYDKHESILRFVFRNVLRNNIETIEHPNLFTEWKILMKRSIRNSWTKIGSNHFI